MVGDDDSEDLDLRQFGGIYFLRFALSEFCLLRFFSRFSHQFIFLYTTEVFQETKITAQTRVRIEWEGAIFLSHGHALIPSQRVGSDTNSISLGTLDYTLVHRTAYVACCFCCFATQIKFIKQKQSKLSTRYVHFSFEMNIHIHNFVIVRKIFVPFLYTLSMETSVTFAIVLGNLRKNSLANLIVLHFCET